ncbi:hypothetical protein FN846DRAFT_885988 [Sphaerosporella brunnea]|uniref:Uncharacterized protein n=1 Tax=Sphaerosporella brunnea TaxID=1250544 RepID=A0A5J5FBK2_9PEZI|nr:hypothetical protein FN846DRAFT_885988 [Sphaerosporella brunnea]
MSTHWKRDEPCQTHATGKLKAITESRLGGGLTNEQAYHMYLCEVQMDYVMAIEYATKSSGWLECGCKQRLLGKSSLARQSSTRSKSDSVVDDDLPAANHPGEEPQAEVVEQGNNFDDVRAELEPADGDTKVVVRANNFDHLPAQHKPVDEEAKAAQHADDFDGLPAEDVEQDNFDHSPAEHKLVDEEAEVVQQADNVDHSPAEHNPADEEAEVVQRAAVFNDLPAEDVEQDNNFDHSPAEHKLVDEEAKVVQQADNVDHSPAEHKPVDEEAEVVQQADDSNVLPAEVVEQANNIDDLPAVQELLISDQQFRCRPQGIAGSQRWVLMLVYWTCT